MTVAEKEELLQIKLEKRKKLIEEEIYKNKFSIVNKEIKIKGLKKKNHPN